MMDEETWMNAEKALELGFIDGILFDEKSTEPNKTEDNDSDGVMFSNIKTNDLLIEKMQKVSFENKNSVPINQLEKRLNLLKK
jgi:ATP-dependent Clp protease protease subunit